MRTINVYKHPTRKSMAVNVSFSWPAFVLVVWMLAKGPWGYAGEWFGITLALKIAEGNVGLTDVLAGAAADHPFCAFVRLFDRVAGPRCFVSA